MGLFLMRFLSIAVLVFSLSSCSSINLTEPQPEPKRQSILGAPLTYSTETGKFFSDSDGNTRLYNSNKNNDLVASLPVNELLWKSSLDVLDFMSLKEVDPFGGVITTDWFINANNNTFRNKVTVSFSSSELKATSIKVSVIREKFENNKWVSDGFSDGLARKIEDLILSRARELRNKS